MCGICGIVNLTRSGNIDQSVLREMTCVMQHRGPDDEGFYIAEHVGFGFRRLSIIDLETGHQPIPNEDKTMWIIFNGEIYNYRELRLYLLKRGHNFTTVTDTEVILHLYEEFGSEAVQHLNGIFAFVIWDSRRQELFIARDRMGIKPLYYCEVNGYLVFGSEMKVVLANPLVRRDLDLISLNEYLSFEYVPSPRTIIRNVKRIPPGHVLHYSIKGLQLNRYWNISMARSESRPPMDWREYAAKLDNVLLKSVEMELMSDVPVGVLLSGGLDSSAIASYMTGLYPGQVESFSIGFEEASFDESRYAQLVAKHLGTKHHELVLTSKMASELVPKITNFLDEPFADSSLIPTYLLSQFAGKHVKVVLGGDGGDELFAGYPTLVAHRLIEYYESLVPYQLRAIAIPKLLKLMPVSFDNISIDFKIRRFLAGRGVPLLSRHHRWLGAFVDDEKKLLLSEWVKPVLRDTYAQVYDYDLDNDAHISLNRILYADMKLYLEGDILYKVDRASMANSLEVRVPFLNTEVIDFVTSLPLDFKLRRLTGKFLLKKASKSSLPSEIIYRKKKGFNMPVAYWLNSDLRKLVVDMLSEDRLKKQGIFQAEYVTKLMRDHFSQQQDNRKLLWTLLIFQMWYAAYMEK